MNGAQAPRSEVSLPRSDVTFTTTGLTFKDSALNYLSGLSDRGSTITGYLNGTDVLSANDSSYTSVSFDQPWNWATAGGTWSVVNNDSSKTSGRNGIYQGVAGSGGMSTALAGSTSWKDYEYSSLLEFPSGPATGDGR